MYRTRRVPDLNDPENFFVLTGGPGSGKTALIEALERTGHARSVEAGRAIIQDQVAIGGGGLPWLEPILFAELMLSWEMRSYHLAECQTGRVFFDRGVPDVVGFLRLKDLPVPAHIEKAAETFRYNRRVFVAPPWADIFVQDNERTQSFEEAVQTYEMLARTYVGYGYELIELPPSPVNQRMQFVIETVVGANP